MGGKRNYFLVAEDLDTLFRLGMKGDVLYFPQIVYIHHLRQSSISHSTRNACVRFFNAQAHKFTEQRQRNGTDDLDLGGAETWDEIDELPEEKPEYLNERATGILTANAFYNQSNGRNRIALAQIIHALSLNYLLYTSWRSFFTISIRSILSILKYRPF